MIECVKLYGAMETEQYVGPVGPKTRAAIEAGNKQLEAWGFDAELDAGPIDLDLDVEVSAETDEELAGYVEGWVAATDPNGE